MTITHLNDRNDCNIINVLLVDDEDDQLELARTHLEEIDSYLHVDTVNSPKVALMILNEEFHECVISDYSMPEMNGIELCRVLKQTRRMPFILFTGRGSEEVTEAAFKVGVDDYIRKEASLSSFSFLAYRIRQVVEKHRVESLRSPQSTMR